MAQGKAEFRVLLVSAGDKIGESIEEILSSGRFWPLLRAKSCAEAKRMLMDGDIDIVIINTPLADDFGTETAADIVAEGTQSVMLLVRAELYEQVSYKAEEAGVLTLPKPVTRQMLYMALRLLAGTSVRLKKLEKKNKSLKEKMEDIRIVNRAKWLLIENMNMSEKDAHYYIEKEAMDTRLARKQVAEHIIRTYDK